jgi:tyrosinase
METELRHLEPTFAIPYWDWSVDRAIPTWLQGFLPTGVVDAAGQPIPVTRSPGTLAPALPTAQDIANTLAQPTYTNFTLRLEGARPSGGMHNLVHVWVGGTMASIPSAPADPIFWLNHAQVDRIWAAWELNHPGGQPALSGSAAVLDPWPQTATEMQSIATLGYQYT